MATVALKPFNTITLPADTPTQLVAPTMANWYIQILNLGPGQIAVGVDATVAVGAANSFTMGVGLGFTGGPVWGPDGRWVIASAAGEISVALIPLQGDQWVPPPTGSFVVSLPGAVGEILFNNGPTNFGAANGLYWDNAESRLELTGPIPLNATTPEFADDAAAIAGGLQQNDFYHDSTGVVHAVL